MLLTGTEGRAGKLLRRHNVMKVGGICVETFCGMPNCRSSVFYFNNIVVGLVVFGLNVK